QLLGLEATADRLNDKLGGLRVSVRSRFTLGSIGKAAVSRQGLVNLFTGAGVPGGGGIGDFLTSPAGLGGIGGASLPLSALIDALAGFGIGSGVGAAGALGAYKAQPGAFAPGLRAVKSSLSNVFKSIAPSLGLMFAQLGRFVQAEQVPLAKLF